MTVNNFQFGKFSLELKFVRTFPFSTITLMLLKRGNILIMSSYEFPNSFTLNSTFNDTLVYFYPLKHPWYNIKDQDVNIKYLIQKYYNNFEEHGFIIMDIYALKEKNIFWTQLIIYIYLFYSFRFSLQLSPSTIF